MRSGTARRPRASHVTSSTTTVGPSFWRPATSCWRRWQPCWTSPCTYVTTRGSVTWCASSRGWRTNFRPAASGWRPMPWTPGVGETSGDVTGTFCARLPNVQKQLNKHLFCVVTNCLATPFLYISGLWELEPCLARRLWHNVNFVCDFISSVTAYLLFILFLAAASHCCSFYDSCSK